MAPAAPSTASSRAATGRSPSLSLDRIASTVDASIHPLDQPPDDTGFTEDRQLPVDPPHDGATWMSFHDRITSGKAETDRPLVVHPGAHPQQRWTYVAGHGIRLSYPPDEPSLTRAVDEQIRSEDVVSAEVLVQRDLEVLPLAPLLLFLNHPAEPLGNGRLPS